MRIPLSILFILGLLVTACRPDEVVSDDRNATLHFSADQISFDTIFTSIGSVTKRLRVYNPNKNALNISSIELGGKANSQFSIIINGLSTYYTNDFFLRGGDSIYILVKVTIDPQNQSLPYLVSDSILFTTNGNLQKVKLMAFGQDATFLDSHTVPCNTTWTNIKPFVITNYLQVAAGCTLTLDKGVRVYFHDDAVMNVSGTLLVQGDKDSVVTFSGDKFSKTYEDLPGQWEGIVFDPTSKNNSIDWALIKNALTGIKILNDPSDTDTLAEVKISNSIIKNMQGACIEAEGTDVYAVNTLFANAVRHAFAGAGGGNYHFLHCTFANYSFSFFREQAALEFSNSMGTLSGPLKARLTNCIVWGDRSDELVLKDNGSNPFSFSALRTIFKTTRTDQNINGNLINSDPQFESQGKLDFHLKDASPAIDAGVDVGIAEDLDGKVRDASPDLGAYEK